MNFNAVFTFPFPSLASDEFWSNRKTLVSMKASFCLACLSWLLCWNNTTKLLMILMIFSVNSRQSSSRNVKTRYLDITTGFTWGLVIRY